MTALSTEHGDLVLECIDLLLLGHDEVLEMGAIGCGRDLAATRHLGDHLLGGLRQALLDVVLLCPEGAEVLQEDCVVGDACLLV